MGESIDKKVLRTALGTFATGVTIVTTRDAGADIGLTANSFNSVSLEPPMVLWSLAKSSFSLPAFQNGSYFAVHVLAADQEPLSNLFAKRGADKFAGLALERGEGGVPLLPGCAARFICRTAFQYEGGDHIIFVGEVLSLDHFPRAPLVFHGGTYAVAARKALDLSVSAATQADQESGSYSEDFFGYLLGRAHFQMYRQVKIQLDRHGLSSDEHFVLSVLAICDARTREEVDDLIAYTGSHVTDVLVERLTARGLISVDNGRLYLSGWGRRINIELMAVAKAAEADALMHLDYSEAQVLKHLLKRLIHGTDPGVPDLWAPSKTGAE
jgi:3-hydroxy-9,10-secoandrosta-1,3,5(10)-triene-9,17-dione monooxygenase reductase component